MATTPALSCYLRGLAVGALLPILAVAAFNAVVDPYRVLHESWIPNASFPGDPRILVPNLIRISRYDGVVAGTSHCDNFLPSVVESELGWKPLRVTLPGSEFPQQVLAVRTAIGTGQVQHVIWGLDLFAFYGHPDRLSAGATDFPRDYYDRSFRTIPNYLLNFQTFEDAQRCLAGRGDTSLEMRGTWHTKCSFSETETLKHSVKQLAAAWQKQALYREAGWDTIATNIRTQLIPVIAEHPQIEFRFLFPPICALGYLAEFQDGGAAFDERLRFRAAICEVLAEFPNVKLYDFEIAAHVSHDLTHCKDLTHYSADINHWMLKQMAAEQHRLTPHTLANHQEWFASATREFVEPILTGQHPWAIALKMDRFPTEMTQPTVMQASHSVPARQ